MKVMSVRGPEGPFPIRRVFPWSQHPALELGMVTDLSGIFDHTFVGFLRCLTHKHYVSLEKQQPKTHIREIETGAGGAKKGNQDEQTTSALFNREARGPLFFAPFPEISPCLPSSMQPQALFTSPRAQEK